ncbi:MAG TPA: ATPase domain-containing protein [Thermoplasmata archaeon]|jgi:circadian clock protein KaiC|nr:ATPase domain-containing protein [Thermoplasmata archaeon]
MAHGVEWVEPAAGPAGRPEEDVEEQVRELRDQVRRLQEQMTALAAGPKEPNGRVPTHVAGLDVTLEGGIPRGHVVLLSGPTGAMKTSLALYMLTRNRAAGVRGLYVTLEEGRDSIAHTMRRLGLGDTEDFIVDIGRLRLEHAGAEEVRDWTQILRDYLVRRREREPIGVVVIDSLNALAALAGIRRPRSELFHFLNFLRSLGLTTILIVERDGPSSPIEEEVDFLADGVLELRFSGAGQGRVQLLIRCVKMRHTNHSRDYFVLSFGERRFVARPYGAGPKGWRNR